MGFDASPRSDWEAELRARMARGELVLPPLPEVAQRVLALVGDEDASAAELAELVRRDASLAAAVLRRANGAASASRVKIVSLQQALTHLGMRHVAEIAAAVSVRGGLFVATRHRDLVRECWRHSLATALCAREIARELRANVEIAYVCGLLWQVGRPLVVQGLEQLGPPSPAEAEVRVLAESLGRSFTVEAAGRWELPESVSAAIRAERADANAPTETWLCELAVALADRALAGDESVDGLVGDAAAERLNLYPETLADLLAKAGALRSELEAGA